MSYQYYFIGTIIILFFSNTGKLKAQTTIDSLKIELTKDHIKGSTQVTIYLDLAKEYLYDDNELSKSHIDSAYTIATNIKEKQSIGLALESYGNYYYVKGETRESIKYYEEALATYPFSEDSLQINNCFFSLSGLYYDLGEFQKAIEYILINLRVNQKNNMQSKVCHCYNSLGNIFKRLTNFTKSEEYLFQSYYCASDLKDSIRMAIASGNLQALYSHMSEFDKALEMGEITLALETALQNQSGIGYCHYVDGYCYVYQGKYEEALEKGLLSLPLLENEHKEIYGSAYHLVGRSLLYLGRHQESLNYLKTAEDIANIGDYIELKDLATTDLSILYEKMNQDNLALSYARKQEVIRDSMFNVEKVMAVNRIDGLYKSAQKDNDLYKQSLKIEKQNKEKQKILSAFSIFSLLLLSGLTLLFYRNKKNKIINLKESAIQSQQIAQLQKEKQILSLSSMIEGQESERKRIAQDLHDGLGGLLATIKIKFGIIQKEIEALESLNVYNQTSTMIDDACTEVRKIAHNMMPDSLTKLGLIEAIRDISDYTSDINIKLINLGTHQFTDTQQIMLYRVIQEFINNSRKHANAHQIIIQFSTSEDQSFIYLEDDGNGFNMDSSDYKKGLGLKSMESRINFLGGTFELDSTLDVGTTIQIKIPR